MDLKKSQHLNYSFEAIPVIFHSQTKDFEKYIEGDGMKFLEFWWNHVGERLTFDKLTPFTNVSYEKLKLNEKTKIYFICLPHPRDEGEMYFLGLIRNPERRFGWVRLPSTRAIGLVRRAKDDFPSGTEMGDLTPRGLFVSLGEGPEPTQAAFKNAVIELANKMHP